MRECFFHCSILLFLLIILDLHHVICQLLDFTQIFFVYISQLPTYPYPATQLLKVAGNQTLISSTFRFQGGKAGLFHYFRLMFKPLHATNLDCLDHYIARSVFDSGVLINLLISISSITHTHRGFRCHRYDGFVGGG